MKIVKISAVVCALFIGAKAANLFFSFKENDDSFTSAAEFEKFRLDNIDNNQRPIIGILTQPYSDEIDALKNGTVLENHKTFFYNTYARLL